MLSTPLKSELHSCKGEWILELSPNLLRVKINHHHIHSPNRLLKYVSSAQIWFSIVISFLSPSSQGTEGLDDAAGIAHTGVLAAVAPVDVRAGQPPPVLTQHAAEHGRRVPQVAPFQAQAPVPVLPGRQDWGKGPARRLRRRRRQWRRTLRKFCICFLYKT